ncbi:MAG: hypothetical protein RL077_5981, partial [Verrucomicrobiota bacterium]
MTPHTAFKSVREGCPRFGARTVAREIAALPGIDIGDRGVTGEVDGR